MKIVIALLTAIIIVISLTSCNAQEAQKISAQIGDIVIYETEILTKEEKDKIKELNERRDKAVEESNVEELKKIRSEWNKFSDPIEQYIEIYYNAANNAFSDDDKKLLTVEEISRSNSLKAELERAYKSRNENRLKAAAKEFNSYVGGIRAVIDLYNEIDLNRYSKAEISLLESKKQSQISQYKSDCKAALKSRDVKKLRSLQSSWDTFTDKTDESLDEAKKDLMESWVKSANLTNSITNIFSFGTFNSDTTIEGNTIIFTTQYNTNFGGSDEDIEAALNSYLKSTSSVFQAGVDYLKKYIDDISIRIEYKNADGDVVSEKEFS